MSNYKQLREAREARMKDRQKAMNSLYTRWSARKRNELAQAQEMDAYMAEQEAKQQADLYRQQKEGSKGWLKSAAMGASAGMMFSPVGAAIGGLAGAGLGILGEASQKRAIDKEHGKKLGWGRALKQTVGRAPTMEELTMGAMSAANVGAGMRKQGTLDAKSKNALLDQASTMSNPLMTDTTGMTSTLNMPQAPLRDAHIPLDTGRQQLANTYFNRIQNLNPHHRRPAR